MLYRIIYEFVRVCGMDVVLIVYYIGKFLEALGIVVLLVALFYGLTTGDVRYEFRLFFAGIMVFLVGRGLEWWAGAKND